MSLAPLLHQTNLSFLCFNLELTKPNQPRGIELVLTSTISLGLVIYASQWMLDLICLSHCWSHTLQLIECCCIMNFLRGKICQHLIFFKIVTKVEIMGAWRVYWYWNFELRSNNLEEVYFNDHWLNKKLELLYFYD